MGIVIVGSGIAGITCAEELAKAGLAVTLVTRETAGHYSRPLLSHGFSNDDVEQRIVTRAFDALRQHGIQVHAGCEARAIDGAARKLACAGAQGPFSLDYDTLVLAPGSEAFVPPPLMAFRENFHVLNSLDDLIALRRLRQQALKQGQRPRWALIGGGLIGCEVASDLAKAGDNVVLFHMADRLMERQLLEDDAATLLQVFQQSDIAVELNCNVASIEADGNWRVVVTDRGRHGGFPEALVGPLRGGFHGVLVACGFKPRTQLAQAAGLPVQRGISVDGFLRTADPAIHAVGDAAQYADGRVYAFIAPIRSQAQWLARYLAGATNEAWVPPVFHPKAKIHGFTASHPYRL